MKIQLDNIKINKTYLKLVPRMNTDDDRAFDISIKENGIKEKLILNQDYVLLDGHSRYSKAKKYKILSVPYEIKKFKNKLLEKKYVIECNLQRRHLTNYQKVQLGIPLLEIEKKLANARKQAALKQNKPLGSNDPNGKGKSVEIIGKKVGVSSTTMMRGKYIEQHGTPEQKKRLEQGKTSINTIYNHLTREKRNIPKTPLPSGSWSVILIDLPIQFNDQGVRGSSSNNYNTIPLAECKLGIINNQDIRELFTDDCMIFAWFQASTIFYAKDILSAWGFECQTNIVWDKMRSGTGSLIDNQHEHLVMAKKGTMPIPAVRIPSVIHEQPTNRLHSSKPVKFYELIESMYPKRKYLDLFSRYKHNDNWTCFGNQLQKFESVNRK